MEESFKMKECKLCEHHECFDCPRALWYEEENISAEYDSEVMHPLDDLGDY